MSADRGARARRCASVQLLTALALVIAFSGAPALRAAELPPAPKYFVDVRIDNDEQLKALAAQGFDIAGVDSPNKAAGVVGDEAELARLRANGWVYTIRERVGAPEKALGQYTDPLEMNSFINAVVAAHPNLAQKVLLQGTLFEGQQQWAVHITKDVAQPNLRPRFLLDAQHHAREVMTPEIAMDMIDRLTYGYAGDPQVRRWVDNIDIWIVPIVNPDGAAYVFSTDTSWRRNRHPSCAVDNNRNYPFMWAGCNGSSGSCSSDTHRGVSPGSEPETQGVLNLTADKRPMYALSYHSYGEYIMYSYGCSDPNERSALDAIAQELNSKLEKDDGLKGGWKTGPIFSTIYSADGGSVDAQYGLHGAYAFVIEVNTGGFQPDYDTWRNVTVNRQRTAWQYFLDKTLDGPQIRGRITDARTGAPLAATVSASQVVFTHGEAPRRADDRGLYHWLTLPGSTYTMNYSMAGYCSQTRSVTAGAGASVVDVQLDHPDSPSGTTAVANGNYRIDVSWTGIANATEYRVYRALEATGPWTLAGTVGPAVTTFADTGISGGVTWYYAVRGFNECESPNSNIAAASTTGACTIAPVFAGASAATDAASSTCTIGVDWPAAKRYCAGPLTYDVYRSTTAPFTPASSNLVAAGLAGTHFDDHAALSSGVTQYYIVRAIDATSGLSDGNVVTVSAAPTGPRVPGTWADDAGDTGTSQFQLQAPWSVLPTGGKTAPKVYATGTYSDNLCTAITSPTISLQSSSVLTFASKYDIETNYDAGVVEVAVGPSFSTWTKLATVNYPDSLSNSGNSCGIATGGAGTAFSRGNTTPAYPTSAYQGALSAYANKDIRLRFRFGTDGGVTGQGWWVDDVRVTNALIPGACASGAVPTPKEVSAGVPMTATRNGASVDVLYAPACGALDTAAFWGTGRITGAPAWTGAACALGTTGRASFTPGGTLPPGGLAYFVLVGQRGAVEGSYGRRSSGAERPEAVGVGTCDAAQNLGGACP